MKSWKDRRGVADERDKEFLGFYAVGTLAQVMGMALLMSSSVRFNMWLTIAGTLTLCGSAFCFYSAGIASTRWAFWMGHEEVDAEQFPEKHLKLENVE